MKKYTIILLIMLIILSCSSAPKSTGEVNTVRSRAETLLESANKEASRGYYENALLIINESKRNAVLADDPSLIARCSLLRGNILFTLGRTNEAFSEWEYAVAEAQRFGNPELISVCRIFLARGMLSSGRASAQSVLDIVNREAVNIRNDQMNIAVSWQVRGAALRVLGSYTEAENAIRQSLAIQERAGYLENVSYDWYTIASIRSLAGDTQGAIQALETALSIDRRIENTWGLAANWRAMGDVLRKAGREQEALEAYNRSLSIYIALGNDYEIEEAKKRIKNE
jgi:tetratricopeptide (TPR) repeat protein